MNQLFQLVSFLFIALNRAEADSYKSKKIWSRDSNFWSDNLLQNPFSSSIIIPSVLSTFWRLAKASKSCTANSLESAIPSIYRVNKEPKEGG